VEDHDLGPATIVERGRDHLLAPGAVRPAPLVRGGSRNASSSLPMRGCLSRTVCYRASGNDDWVPTDCFGAPVVCESGYPEPVYDDR
jgi:hypothetical protein